MELYTVSYTIYRVGQKLDFFKKIITSVYDDLETHSIYQSVHLFISS